MSYDYFESTLCRCHVKDLFEIATRTPLLLPIPTNDRLLIDYDDISLLQRKIDEVNVNDQTYLQLYATVYSNPKREMILYVVHQTS